MAQSQRQNNLFAAEDYNAVYESYVNANFQAYDYDSIRTSMVNYVRNNYPEQYNDWIESSEFVALLDLIAQFGHNLAYRTDLNTRNNFLSTADRKDAVLKLAEFLGYQPRRNLTASGKIKITSVKTDEPVIGSGGTSLGGKEVRYESSNTNNLDDFISVMNAVFANSNRFGSPLRQIIDNGVITQFYNLNNLSDQIHFDVTGSVLGKSAQFNLVSFAYDVENKRIVESDPNPNGNFSFIYKNDGKGLSSTDTGFFLGIKQGTLQYKDFNIDSVVDNMSVSLDATDINNTDVWVQTIDSDGSVSAYWTKVNDIFGNNAIYNTVNANTRNIFSVKTLNDDKISIQFPDSSFGNLPTGLIRVWYRTSLNESYVLRPEDIGNKSFTVKYYGKDGAIYNATFGVRLAESITTASTSESVDSIKTNAPRIYATQNRMITAQDYSSYLLSQSENILKIKSVNRTHSGHSRYITPNDPTGMYTNVQAYGTDGVITKEDRVITFDVNKDLGGATILSNYILPILNDSEFVSRFYKVYAPKFEAYRDVQYNYPQPGGRYKLFGDQRQGNSLTSGFFVSELDTSVVQAVGPYRAAGNYLENVTAGSMIKFAYDDTDEVTWAQVQSVFNDGFGVNDISGKPSGYRSLEIDSPGAILVDADIADGAYVQYIYGALPRQFTADVSNTIIENIDNNSSATFYIVYSLADNNWVISEDAGTQDDEFIHRIVVEPSPSSGEVRISYTALQTVLTSSTGQVTFTNLNNEYTIDEVSKKKGRDEIEIVDITNSGVNTYKFYVYGYFLDDSGNFDSTRVRLVAEDNFGDSRPDNPRDVRDVPDNKTIRFEWTHKPAVNEIVDPSFTNIVDVFALTQRYDTAYREWLHDSNNTSQPLPPTIDELNQQFNQATDKKAMSDKIIYRPVKYKVLFGDKAESSFRASFRVVKVANSRITDSELKNKIVLAIYEFFELENWDFGETFYFTELSAHVHNKLLGFISSFIIVPEGSNSDFGELFQINPNTDEIFIPDVSVSDIEIIDAITQDTLRAS